MSSSFGSDVSVHAGSPVEFSRDMQSIKIFLEFFLIVRARGLTPPANPPPSLSSVRISSYSFTFFNITFYTYVAKRTVFTSSAGFIYISSFYDLLQKNLNILITLYLIVVSFFLYSLL